MIGVKEKRENKESKVRKRMWSWMINKLKDEWSEDSDKDDNEGSNEEKELMKEKERRKEG